MDIYNNCLYTTITGTSLSSVHAKSMQPHKTPPFSPLYAVKFLSYQFSSKLKEHDVQQN